MRVNGNSSNTCATYPKGSLPEEVDKENQGGTG